MEYCTDRESYSLASGLALGMVCLGVSASFSFQLQLVEESLYIGTGVMRIVSSLTYNWLWLNGFFLPHIGRHLHIMSSPLHSLARQ